MSSAATTASATCICKLSTAPSLYAIELECVYPEYLDREPRRLPVTGGMRIPEGTQLVLHANSTKPLTAAHVHAAKDKRRHVARYADNGRSKNSITTTARSPPTMSCSSSVTDTDGVATREPYRISLSAVRDEVPQVAVRLSGISTAITPDAMLPVRRQNHRRLRPRSRLVRIPDRCRPCRRRVRSHNSRTASRLSTNSIRSTPAPIDPTTGKRALELKPKQRLTLSLKAADRYNLARSEPRAGSSQQFVLDVVTPADLLALLERRELAPPPTVRSHLRKTDRHPQPAQPRRIRRSHRRRRRNRRPPHQQRKRRQSSRHAPSFARHRAPSTCFPARGCECPARCKTWSNRPTKSQASPKHSTTWARN